jgi:hypothetical protein
MADSFNSTTRPAVNIAATRPPVGTDDNTAGWGVGSEWFDITNNRVWGCLSAATGAAVWAYKGAPLGTPDPSGDGTQFGSGTGSLLAQGNLLRAISAAGVNPGTTGNDNVLAVFSIPASSFDGVSNRGLAVKAWGSFAANVHSKEVKIIINPATAVVGSAVGSGGITACDSGAYTTNANVGWFLGAQLFKYGAAGSNTQLAVSDGAWISNASLGGGTAASSLPQLVTATESGAILVAITGNAGTTATDIALNLATVNGMN